MAIKEWSKLQKREDIALERALSAFDMFVLHNRQGDFEEVSGVKYKELNNTDLGRQQQSWTR
jgi:hypothetical protein